MPGADRQAHEGILKTVFEKKIVAALNQLNPLKDYLKTESSPFGGFEITFPAHVGRGMAGTGWSGEDGAIPDAGTQRFVKMRIGQAKMTAKMRTTWEAMNDTSGGEYAYKASKKVEMEGVISDMARREEAALTLEGRGILARINEATPSGNTTLELDDPGGLVDTDFGNRLIFVDMILAAVNPATGTPRANTEVVSAVNEDGTDVTLNSTPNAAWADNDFVVQANTASASGTPDINDTSWEKAWYGLVGLFDDGTYRTNYFGADRNTYPAFNSYVVASTGALSMDLLQRSVDVVHQKLGGVIDVMFMHHDTRRLVLQIQDSDRRYSGDKLMRPDIGTSAMKQEEPVIGTIPVKVIRDFPYDMVLGIDSKKAAITRYVSEEGKWADESGSILKQIGSGTTLRDSFEAYFRKRQQYFAPGPGYAFRLDAITGTTHVIVRAP